MKLLRILKNDLSEGIFRRSIYFVLPIMISLISCISLHFSLMNEMKLNSNIGAGTVMDYWIYLVQGCKQYKLDYTNLFHIPMSWIGFYSFFLIGLNNYVTGDLEKRGFHVILCAKSRLVWWTSKLLWMLVFTVLYLLVCGITVIVYASLHDASLSIYPSVEVMGLVAKREIAMLSLHRVFLYCVCMPGMLMVVLGILQMSFSLIMDSVQVFIILLGILMASSYRMSLLLPGNWAMPYRMSPVIKNGLSPVICILLLSVVTIAGIICGYFIFRKKDIFGKN